MKKLFFPALILFCISATISCKKEVAPTDEAGSISSQNISNDIISDSTHFGALVDAGTTDARITICKKFGVNCVRAQIILKDFNGKNAAVDKYQSSGFKVLLNLNWDHVSSGGTRKSVPFPKDMATYRNKLAAVLDKYKPEVAVIENEPTTDVFHSGPIEDYITELKNAIEVCHLKGVKVADGAIHIPYIISVMNGKATSGNALEVKKLIDAYTTLDLDYVNVHTAGTGDSYPTESLTKAADYLRAKTGKPVMSNEFSVKSYSTSLIKELVDGFKAGKYKYALVRSGNSESGAVPLHSGTNLLSNGIAYRDEIK
jgi:hypothetical protein